MNPAITNLALPVPARKLTARARILAILEPSRSGMTAGEVTAWTGINPSTVRARLSEMSQEGLIRTDGVRPARNGQSAPVYISLTEAARRAQEAPFLEAHRAAQAVRVEVVKTVKQSWVVRAISWIFGRFINNK